MVIGCCYDRPSVPSQFHSREVFKENRSKKLIFFGTNFEIVPLINVLSALFSFNVSFFLILNGLQTGKMRGDGAFLLLVFICLLGKFQLTFFHYSGIRIDVVFRFNSAEMWLDEIGGWQGFANQHFCKFRVQFLIFSAGKTPKQVSRADFTAAISAG